MESEEVKEIKEKLQEEIFFANSFGDKWRKVPTKELENLLTLINELESENKSLQDLCNKTYEDLTKEIDRLENRVKELEEGIAQSMLGCEFLPECTKEIAEKIWNMAKLVVVATKQIVQGREYLPVDALKEIIKSCGVEIKELDEYEKPENN